jgi:hypothetical protein
MARYFDAEPEKPYHCASVASTEYSRGKGRPEGSLCGELLKFALWDFATEFIQAASIENLEEADLKPCETCLNHEDLDLLLLAEAGEDDGC